MRATEQLAVKQGELAIRFQCYAPRIEEEGKRSGPGGFNFSGPSPLFQPDALIPTQYLETFKRKTHLEGERKLMLAILEDALRCFQKCHFARDKKGKTLFREVEEWIMDETDDQIFSFVNICESLQINPDYLRRGLLKWSEKQLEKRKEAKRHGEMSGLRHGVR